jgi:hypothetical protein
MKFYTINAISKGEYESIEDVDGSWVSRTEAEKLLIALKDALDALGDDSELFAAQQAVLSEGIRANRFEVALRKVSELGGHEYGDCADIAMQALGSTPQSEGKL